MSAHSFLALWLAQQTLSLSQSLLLLVPAVLVLAAAACLRFEPTGCARRS
jgi:hypothetical protein